MIFGYKQNGKNIAEYEKAVLKDFSSPDGKIRKRIFSKKFGANETITK